MVSTLSTLQSDQSGTQVTPAKRLLPVQWRLVLIAFDVVALVLAHYTALQLTPLLGGNLPSLPALEQRLYSFALLGVLVIALMANKGIYSRRLPWWMQVQYILKIIGLALIIDGFSYFTLQWPFSRAVMLTGWVFAAFYLIVFRRLALLIVSQSKDWELPTLIIGDSDTILDSLNAFHADGLTGFRVRSVMLRDMNGKALDQELLPSEQTPLNIIDGNDHYDQFIRQNPGYFYIVSLDGFRGAQRDRLMQALEETGCAYAIIPPIKRLHLHGMEPHYFFGNDIMLLHKSFRLDAPIWRFIKRSMDLCVSGLILPVLGLMTAGVWLAKKLENSPSPVFYGGQRVGLDGKLFPCWKFCTMRPGADQILDEVLAADPAKQEEWERYQKLKDDPRIDSRASAILRKTSLDELPQLWNVFCGDMSLVGPRPILPDQRDDYGDALPLYESTRPGLTGLWQVSGRNETSFRQRITWDCWYVRNWTLGNDIIILFKTVKVLATGDGAY
jgi:undecaprenyl-phosphate galactose phosphotransferase